MNVVIWLSESKKNLSLRAPLNDWNIDWQSISHLVFHFVWENAAVTTNHQQGRLKETITRKVPA